MRQDDDLNRLRGILLGDKQNEVDEFRKRITELSERITQSEKKEQKAQDVSDVLSDAVYRRTDSKSSNDLAEALSDSVEHSIHKSVRNDPQQFADALYPAILPAIRKSISDAFRQMLEQIDSTVKQRFSARSVAWRIEAWRSGTDLSKIVLRENSPFTVDQLLLIQNGSGLLIQHIFQPGIKDVDSDAVSGMLWAIESFVRDSFIAGEESEKDKKDIAVSGVKEGLKEVTTKSHKLYLIQGRLTTLVCVVRGVAPKDFLESAQLQHARLRAGYSKELTAFSGDEQGFPPAEEILSPLLNMRYSEQAEKSSVFKRVKWALPVILLLGVLALAWMGWRYYDGKQTQWLVDQLDSTPGITVFDHRRSAGGWSLKGLADPAAEHPKNIIERSGLHAARYTLKFQPYLSLEPEVALKRARASLSVPDSVIAGLHGESLKLGGLAPTQWYYGLTGLGNLPAGIERLDLSDLSLSTAGVAEFLKSELHLPGSVELSVHNEVIRLKGAASGAWIDSLKAFIDRFEGKIGFDVADLLSAQEFAATSG